jgi:predicted RND superfamily exporter protein
MNSLRYWLVPSVVLATLISLYCLKSLALMSIVFLTSTAAAMISLALIPLTGVEFGGLMSIIPALVFVLTTSGCIHLIHYSMQVGVGAGDVLRVGWLPCVVSASTTIVGMLSLGASQFPAIRKFGLYSALGVAVGLIFQLVLVPWLLQRFGTKAVANLTSQKANHSRFWLNWYRVVNHFRLGFLGMSMLMLIGGSVGLTYLKAQVEVENLFKKDSAVLVSLRKLEEQLGPLDQTELMVVFKPVDGQGFDQRVQQVTQIQQAVESIPEVKFAYSLINFLPTEPKARDFQSFAARSTYRRRLRNERENLSNRRNLFIDGDQEVWRISLRFPFTNEIDWAMLGDKVEQVAKSALASSTIRDSSNQGQSEPELVYTGRANLFQNAQQSLLVDLFLNFLMAFAVITPMLIIALRSISIGLLAMLPNVFPAIVLFGTLGFVGYPVDLAIAMTASIALGIAVDDTTHFLVRFRYERGSLRNAAKPIQRIMEHCGPAMLHTTVIACGGLLVYALGEMLVVARFAVTISILMALALLADLVMMPSILLVLESIFKSKTSSNSTE